MKERLYCRIFGHKFIGTDTWLDKEDSTVKHSKTRPVDFCVNCGIWKKELLENIIK